MQRRSRSWWYGVGGSVLCGVVLAGCQTAERRDDEPGAQRAVATHSRSARVVQDAESLPPLDGPEPTEPVGSAVVQPDLDVNRSALDAQIPDPEDERVRLAERIADEKTDPMLKAFSQAVLERLDAVRRPQQIKLSLKECVERALKHSYRIRVPAYDPAIQASRVVEAEAQFDAVYFLNLSSNKQDRPTSSQLQGTLTEARAFDSGVRKLLSTGTQVSVSYAVTRTYTDLVFQTLNPSWFNQFIVELRQPLFRGFGLDFNRAQIELSKIDRQISVETFRRRLQDELFEVERRYWLLKQARIEVVALARLLANFERIDNYFEVRADFDTYDIQRGQVNSRLESRRAQYVERVANVRNQEDALKSLINDSALPLADDVEIVPIDEFSLDGLALDRLGEVQAALDSRPELREAKLQIEKARVGIGVAKNQALPKADVVFQYKVDGLGGNWDQTFSQLSEARYHEYFVSLQFEWPIGNRGPEAALRRARLQQSQAVVAHAAQIEQIIQEVHQAVRDVQVAYEQIGANLRAAEASQSWLMAIVARQPAKDPANLQVELDATESLAANRSNLATTLSNYAVSIVNLERTKGTLLKYNNIDIRDPGLSRPVAAAWVPPVEAP